MLARSPSRSRREDAESGFTLIELMVVVLIIAILVAIALPTFLGARKRAADRAAETRLRTAYTTARTYYIDSQTYTGIDGPGVLNSIETSVESNTLALANVREVSVRDVATDGFLLVTESTSGAFVCMAENPGGGQIRGLDDAADSFVTITDCQNAPGNW